MEKEVQLVLIARQIEEARVQVDLARKMGEDPELVRLILGGLRLTYLAMSVGLEPRRDMSPGFSMEVLRGGETVLLMDSEPVPVFGPYLEYVFSGAGIELSPGQTLLVEPGLAKHVIEEALGRLAREQAWLDWEMPSGGLGELLEKKLDLVAASLFADDLIERQARDAA